MYAFTHTHTLPPPLNMISSYVCALHISQQAEIHPPTQTHSKSTPKHSNAPSTKYSGRTTIHYLSISPNGWIIHYNSRNDNQLCVINMNIIHTHHTKPTTPCTYLSFGTYASGDEIHVLLRCEFSKSPWHTSKHRRGIVALYYIDCCRRWLRTRSRKLISKFINCKFSDNHEICTLLLLILSLLSYGK